MLKCYLCQTSRYSLLISCKTLKYFWTSIVDPQYDLQLNRNPGHFHEYKLGHLGHLNRLGLFQRAKTKPTFQMKLCPLQWCPKEK